MQADSAQDGSHYQRLLLDRVPSMLAYWDADLRCRFANRAYERWFGVDAATLVGSSIKDLLGPALFALNEPYIRGALNGEEQLFERIVPGPDGVRRHSLANYIPDVVDGAVVGFLVQVTDVTLLKETQAAMQRSEEYLRELFRLSREGIVVADSDGRYVDVNDSCCEMLGYTREDILGKRFDDLVAPAERERLQQARAELQRGERHVQQWILLRKDGQTLPVEVRAKFLADGRRVGYLRDVSDHRRALAFERDMAAEQERLVQARTRELVEASRQLQLNEALLRGLFESTTESIMTVDETGTIMQANPAAARMFRCTIDELIGASLARFIPLRHRAMHHRHMIDFGASGGAARLMAYREVSALRADGEEFPIEASISHLLIEGRHLYTVIHRDITTRKQMQARLESSHADLQRLIAAQEAVQEAERKRIARELHDDLQQTLGAIKMNVRVVSEALRAGQPCAQPLLTEIDELASAAIDSTRRIVNDLRPQMLDELGLAPALDALVGQFGRRHDLSCHFELLGRTPVDGFVAPALTTCLFRVAQEALNNIAKHARATAVDVALEHRAGCLLLRIHDDGVGLAEADQRKPGSFGLMGMHERVRALGGTVRATGSSGAGTTLEVSLPVVDAPPAVSAAPVGWPG